jgi:hypothetical protein
VRKYKNINAWAQYSKSAQETFLKSEEFKKLFYELLNNLKQNDLTPRVDAFINKTKKYIASLQPKQYNKYGAEKYPEDDILKEDDDL